MENKEEKSAEEQLTEYLARYIFESSGIDYDNVDHCILDTIGGVIYTTPIYKDGTKGKMVNLLGGSDGTNNR